MIAKLVRMLGTCDDQYMLPLLYTVLSPIFFWLCLLSLDWFYSAVVLRVTPLNMHSLLTRSLLYLWTFLIALAYSQSSAGYVGYNLTLEGDNESVIYSTDETRPNANFPDPDVYLNASVHVGTIDIEVDELVSNGDHRKAPLH